MLTLNDGRAELWQWDTGRTLAVDADCSQVHFSNKVFGRSIDVDVADGVAIIPDVLLQTDKDLNVWAFVGTAENGYTKISKTFKINRRNKPADYVFTPVEQTTIAEIAAIAQSVRDDADAGLFDGAQGPIGPIGPVGPQGKQGIQGEKGERGDIGPQGPKGDKGDTGPQGKTGLQGPAGADGKDGAPGADGKTPEYGVDYGTPEQIQGIAQQAAALIDFDANQLKEDLSTKIDKPSTAPAVGKILKVTAVNDDGTFVCEWADALSGGISDVQINGTSAVADGVANIPYADKFGLFPGVVAISPARGLDYFGNTNILTVMSAVEKNITDRNKDKVFLHPKILDYAVKAAMCDGKGAAWTAEEQAAARERMGIPIGSGIAVSGATVGQTIKISAVDDDGVPTAWEPVDLPISGSVAPGYRLIGAIVLSEPAAKLEFAIPDGITDIVAHFFNKYDSELSDTYGFFSVNGKSVAVGQNMSLNAGIDQQIALHFTLLTDGKAYVSVSKGSQTSNNLNMSGLSPCGWLNAWNGDFGDAITKVAFSQVNPSKTFGAGCSMEVWGK